MQALEILRQQNVNILCNQITVRKCTIDVINLPNVPRKMGNNFVKLVMVPLICQARQANLQR